MVKQLTIYDLLTDLSQSSFNEKVENEYFFEIPLQKFLFKKVLENHHWKNGGLYDNKNYCEQLHKEIIKLGAVNLAFLVDYLDKNCSICKLRFYGWPNNENKYKLDYQKYRFDNDNYCHLIGMMSFIELIKKTNKCISCLENEKKIKYDVINNKWIELGVS